MLVQKVEAATAKTVSNKEVDQKHRSKKFKVPTFCTVYTVLHVNFNKKKTLGTYEGHSVNSRTVSPSKHTVTVENQSHYEVVGPLLYFTYCGFIYDVKL